MAKTSIEMQALIEQVRLHRNEDKSREEARKSDAQGTKDILRNIAAALQNQVQINQEAQDQAKAKEEEKPEIAQIAENKFNIEVPKTIKGLLFTVATIVILYVRGLIGFIQSLLLKSKTYRKLFEKGVNMFSKIIKWLREVIILETKLPKSPIMRGIVIRFLELIKFMRRLGEGLKPVITLIREIKFVDNIVLKFLRAVQAIKSFAYLGAKVFYVLNIILGIFDFMLGAIKGWRESEATTITGKFVDAAVQGIKSLINTVIGIPLDMLKRALGWILGKIGFTNAEEGLKKFKFTDLFDKAIDDFMSGDLQSNVLELMLKVINMPLMLFKKGVAFILDKVGATNLSDMVGEFNPTDLLKWVLKKILPHKDAGKKWYNPQNLVANAIPSWVYKFAGKDKVGNILEQETNIADQNAANERAGRSAGGGAPIAVSSQNVNAPSTSVIVNNSQHVEPFKGSGWGGQQAGILY